MVIVKFALFFFLIALVWIAVLRGDLGLPYGGPFYYADPVGLSNPMQPRYRLSFERAWASNRCVEVYTNSMGLPVLARHRVAHQVVGQMVWIWTKNGRLMRRYAEGPQGHLLKIDVMPLPAASSPKPQF